MPLATVTVTFDMVLLAIAIWFALFVFTEVFAVIMMVAFVFIVGGAFIIGTVSHELTGWPDVHFIQVENLSNTHRTYEEQEIQYR